MMLFRGLFAAVVGVSVVESLNSVILENIPTPLGDGRLEIDPKMWARDVVQIACGGIGDKNNVYTPADYQAALVKVMRKRTGEIAGNGGAGKTWIGMGSAKDQRDDVKDNVLKFLRELISEIHDTNQLDE